MLDPGDHVVSKWRGSGAASDAATSSWCCRTWRAAAVAGWAARRWSPPGTASGPSACCRAACGQRCDRSPRSVGGSCPAGGARGLCGWAGCAPARNPPALAWSGPAGRPGSGWGRPPSSGSRSPPAVWQSRWRWGRPTEGSARWAGTRRLMEMRERKRFKERTELH